MVVIYGGLALPKGGAISQAQTAAVVIEGLYPLAAGAGEVALLPLEAVVQGQLHSFRGTPFGLRQGIQPLRGFADAILPPGMGEEVKAGKEPPTAPRGYLSGQIPAVLILRGAALAKSSAMPGPIVVAVEAVDK